METEGKTERITFQEEKSTILFPCRKKIQQCKIISYNIKFSCRSSKVTPEWGGAGKQSEQESEGGWTAIYFSKRREGEERYWKDGLVFGG